MPPSSSSSCSACTLTSQFLMVCGFPRGASKNSCSLAPVLTCSSLPAETAEKHRLNALADLAVCSQISPSARRLSVHHSNVNIYPLT